MFSNKKIEQLEDLTKDTDLNGRLNRLEGIVNSLKKDVEELETQITEDVEITKSPYSFLNGYCGNGLYGSNFKSPTIKSKIDAIAEYIGVDFKIKSESTKVEAEKKAVKKKAAKKSKR